MSEHPDLASEQAHIDRAYEALEEMRREARRLVDSVIGQSQGGTHAARFERDVFVQTGLERLERLQLGSEPLVFGRLDQTDDDSFHIGRLAVAGEDRQPLVVDWRAPAAEPFYRATGRHPMGLRLRRHLICEGQKLLQIHDEHLTGEEPDEVGGTDALLYALEQARTGQMRDIVATVQREQDEIIRAPLRGVLVVQGGPGTGKTAVALHRAAYLLFTHRRTLERDGVLVVGPNQLFLRYIDQVLPALGESGAALTTIAGMVDVRARASEADEVARLKGDPRMARVLAKAVADRRRPLRRRVEALVGKERVHLTVADSKAILAAAKRRRGPHNAKRRFVDRLVVDRLHERYVAASKNPEPSEGDQEPDLDPRDVANDVHPRDIAADVAGDPALLRAREWMWPRLAPHELVHDLYGSRALLASAADGILTAAEQELLFRPWSDDPDEAPFTHADLALIDEAAVLLGPLRREEDERPPYGHVVVDEAQDLSPMELRMLGRRSRRGSMTVVGDIAQATGPWGPKRWEEVLEHLPADDGAKVMRLTVNYRTPAEIMRLAEGVLEALPVDLAPPESIRSTGEEPEVVGTSDEDLAAEVARRAEAEREHVAPGTVAVLCAPTDAPRLRAALSDATVPFGEAAEGLDRPVTLVPVDVVKGLEFDAAVVCEPARVVREAAQGAHALYVALTRPTKRLVIVHAEPLPDELT